MTLCISHLSWVQLVVLLLVLLEVTHAAAVIWQINWMLIGLGSLDWDSLPLLREVSSFVAQFRFLHLIAEEFLATREDKTPIHKHFSSLCLHHIH